MCVLPSKGDGCLIFYLQIYHRTKDGYSEVHANYVIMRLTNNHINTNINRQEYNLTFGKKIFMTKKEKNAIFPQMHSALASLGVRT